MRKKTSASLPKVEVALMDFRVWCERCCIRLAPNEERTVAQGKSYHPNCYSKITTKPDSSRS